MKEDKKMPWDDAIKVDYSDYCKDPVESGTTIGSDKETKYGQGKPIRITILGDITSDISKSGK